MAQAADLQDQLALLCAGHTTGAASEALTRMLSNILGFSCSSLGEADELIDAVALDMKSLVRANWHQIRAAAKRPARAVAHG